MKQLFNYLFHSPNKLLLAILVRIAPIVPDKLYIKWRFYLTMGYKLNLDNPKSFNEKLQWLKLYNRKPEYTQMVDKYEAKKYVANLIGEEYIIPTLGVWDKFEDIDFDKLPNQFVLKTTHGGGGKDVIICKDKSKFDFIECEKVMARSMKHNIYTKFREWPYKNIKPRIIAEEYVTNGGSFINDYKFFCFNGEPKAMLVASGRYVEPETCFDYFDMDFNHFPFEQGGPNYNKPIPKPALFEEMKVVAKKLSQGLPHARIDLYEVNGCVKFGEITFFDSSGFAEFKPKKWNYIFGSWIELPTKKH